jgi:hypothetical protein
MVASWQLRETTWNHAANFIGLYDATGSGFLSKPAIKKNVQLAVTEITPALPYRILNKGDRVVLLLPDHNDLYRQKSKDHLRAQNPDQIINDQDLAVTQHEIEQPVSVIANIRGFIEDVSRFYNPRYFSLDLQALDINDPYKNSLALYRNLGAIQVTAAGSIRGHLVLEDDQALAWALITLVITLDNNQSLEIRAQANQFGDFLIPLTELPALEPDALINAFTANLSVRLCELVDNKPDPDHSTAATIKNQLADANGAATFVFEITYGQHLKLTTAGHESLVIQP